MSKEREELLQEPVEPKEPTEGPAAAGQPSGAPRTEEKAPAAETAKAAEETAGQTSGRPADKPAAETEGTVSEVCADGRSAGASDSPPAAAAPSRKWWKKPVWIVLLSVAAVLLAVYGGLCVAAGVSGTVAGRVYVMDVDMSGLTREQAARRWDEEQAALLERTAIPLTVEGESLGEVTLQQMGASASGEAAAAAAWDVTHGHAFLGGWQLLRSWFAETRVQPRWTVDSGAMRRCAASISEATYTPAVDGAWRMEKEKTDGLYVTCAADGRRLDPAQLMTALRTALEQGDLSGVAGVYIPVAAIPLDLETLHQEICGDGVSAMYDKSTGGLTEERVGVQFDVAAAKEIVAAAQPGTEVVIPAEITAPKVTKEALEKVLFRDELGSFTTYVSGTWDRIENVKIAARNINYWVLNPGESFSYNDAVGPTDAAHGFSPAPGYVGGETVDVYGGGVCQVSSTLYYATLLSNLEIVTRYCHQFAPGYIRWGCDATVYEGPVDFVFRNNTDYPIRIVTSRSGANLTVSIQGTKVDDSYVEMVTSVEAEYPYETIYQEVDTLAPGVEVVEQYPYTGYTVYAWRYVYAGDGTLLSSDLESVSNYESRDMIIKVGKQRPPAPKPEPPAPTPSPVPPSDHAA